MKYKAMFEFEFDGVTDKRTVEPKLHLFKGVRVVRVERVQR